jgi:hypothetical protein
MNVILRLAMWAAILVSVAEARRRKPALRRTREVAIHESIVDQ